MKQAGKRGKKDGNGEKSYNTRSIKLQRNMVKQEEKECLIQQ